MPEDEIHERVVAQIRALARRRKIPISHLPDRAGVSRSHFWDVMKGRASPTIEWLQQIAVALGVDVEELVKRSEDD